MKITKLTAVIFGASFLLLSGIASQSDAGVNISLGLFAPPQAYVVPAPPPVVVVPGTYVYAVPESGLDIVFYHGYWWRPYNGHWYRSNRYDGAWTYMRPERVPRPVFELPPDYRSRFHDGRRISNADMHRNWKRWERDRYWDRHDNRRDRYEDRRDRGRDHDEGHWGRDRH